VAAVAPEILVYVVPPLLLTCHCTLGTGVAEAAAVKLTAVPTFASDSGLADRLIVVRLKRREGATGDSAIFDEITANRDAGLSFVCYTLAAALADRTATPAGLNQRHPDFAALAVRLGRSIGREAETVSALAGAESDKSLFCLQNDSLGSALLTLVSNDTQFTGGAAELRTALAAADPAIGEWSNKGVGRRLADLWPHVVSVFAASRSEVRGAWVFRIAKRPTCGFAALNVPFH